MVHDAALKESDPYRPPAFTDAMGAKPIAAHFDLPQSFFFLVMVLGHLFFWAMLLTWGERWLSEDSSQPLPLRDLTMIGSAFVCVVTTGVALHAVIRRKNLLSISATVGSVAAFVILLFVDWYG